MLMRNTLILLIGLVLAGCSSSPKIRYYTLHAPSSSATAADIVIGPISLPEAVDRTQFVVRTGDNSVDISDANRWAEPLKSGIARVLRANVMQWLKAGQGIETTEHLSGGAKAAVTAKASDIRIALDILNFEAVLGQTVTIEARWTIHYNDDSKPLRGYARVQETLTDSDYAAVAAGYGRALAQISREIVSAWRLAGLSFTE